MIQSLAGQGYSAKLCCRILGVAPAGYFRWRRRVPTAAELRRHWLTGLISDIHVASRGTYGRRRIRAELVIGLQLIVSRKLVARVMTEAGLHGLPLRKNRKRNVGAEATCSDLVQRDFHRDAPNRLWMTDITEHPTREGKLYCCVVLDAHSRRVVGWSIDSTSTVALVANALGMAINNRQPASGAVVHSDHGSQGGLNRSSQHLDHGGVAWERCGSDSVRSSYIAARFRRRGERRWRGVKIGSGSGRRSLAA